MRLQCSRAVGCTVYVVRTGACWPAGIDLFIHPTRTRTAYLVHAHHAILHAIATTIPKHVFTPPHVIFASVRPDAYRACMLTPTHTNHKYAIGHTHACKKHKQRTFYSFYQINWLLFLSTASYTPSVSKCLILLTF